MGILKAAEIEIPVTVPIVVIGAGACGLVAALAAKREGVDVLVLERDRVPSGSTALSSGMIPACGTRLQSKAGVDDSPAIMAADILEKTQGEADQGMVKAICRASGPAIDWLIDDLAVELTLVEGFLYPGHSRLRMHAPPSRTGEELIGSLIRAAELMDVDLMTSAHVTDLVVDDDTRIVGIRIQRPDGSSEYIGCDSLILACNGFGGNPELVRRYLPDMADALYFGHGRNRGEAILWGAELDARLEHLGSYQGHGSVAYPHNILITWALMMEGGIQVNGEGKRFSNEHQGYSEQARAVLAQPGGIAWNIYDERLHLLGREFEDYRQAEKAGAIVTAPDLVRLAGELGIPAVSLATTVDKATDYARGQADPFGRNFAAKPALQSPYFAVKVTGALFHTQGGIVVDDNARAMQADGRPFPNLFAGGGAACGVSGSSDRGYLSGNGLLTAVVLGRLAGVSAAQHVRESTSI
jgi:fumarate reductase flavoprotein subunit